VTQEARPNPTDWAYAAGFVDGEGCIAITRGLSRRRGRYYYSVGVVVANRQREALDWLLSMWDGWVVQASSNPGNARPSWVWRSRTGGHAGPFLEGIRPWLKLKGPQCDNALAMVALMRRSHYTLGRTPLPDEWLREQEELYWIQRELNHRGARAFEAKPMHSPRQIARQRASANTA